MKKIVYITAKAPLGYGEVFIINEMAALKKICESFIIIPRDRSDIVFHEKSKLLIDNTLKAPLFNMEILKELLKYFFTHTSSFLKLMKNVVFQSGNMRIALKNLAVFPKALYLSAILKKESISHIHAHWGSTTSSMAYIMSEILIIPWSFTLHRWDIYENNILKVKLASASFIRCISSKGRNDLLNIVGSEFGNKVRVIHVGVDLPNMKEPPKYTSGRFTFICPANLVTVKGHKYLIEACKVIFNRSKKYKCLIAGHGSLEHKLKDMVRSLKLDNYIEFLGQLPHEKLVDLYINGKINAVVLPSIITEDGDQEGIPVSLMEAMSHCIPVVSTNTGGIPELLGDGSGLMVEEKNPLSIANALEKLMNDEAFCEIMSKRGREKIEREFNSQKISTDLLNAFSSL